MRTDYLRVYFGYYILNQFGRKLLDLLIFSFIFGVMPDLRALLLYFLYYMGYTTIYFVNDYLDRSRPDYKPLVPEKEIIPLKYLKYLILLHSLVILVFFLLKMPKIAIILLIIIIYEYIRVKYSKHVDSVKRTLFYVLLLTTQVLVFSEILGIDLNLAKITVILYIIWKAFIFFIYKIYTRRTYNKHKNDVNLVISIMLLLFFAAYLAERPYAIRFAVATIFAESLFIMIQFLKRKERLSIRTLMIDYYIRGTISLYVVSLFLYWLHVISAVP